MAEEIKKEVEEAEETKVDTEDAKTEEPTKAAPEKEEKIPFVKRVGAKLLYGTPVFGEKGQKVTRIAKRVAGGLTLLVVGAGGYLLGKREGSIDADFEELTDAPQIGTDSVYDLGEPPFPAADEIADMEITHF